MCVRAHVHVCVYQCACKCVVERERKKREIWRETDVMDENSFLAHATSSFT